MSFQAQSTYTSKHIQLTKPRILHTTPPPMTLIQMKVYKVYTTRKKKKQKRKKLSTLNPCPWKNVSVHQVVQLASGSYIQTHLQVGGIPHRGSAMPNNFFKQVKKII